MNAPAGTDTRLIHRVAAYLCRAEGRQHASTAPYRFDPRYRAIRQASGRRDLLRNLEAAALAARG